MKKKTKAIRFSAPSTVMQAYDYCVNNVKKKTTPKYVRLQMKDFMRICEGKDRKYKISESKLNTFINILKILNMPKGIKAGQSIYECAVGYQWLFWVATLCVVYRSDESRRRYETGVLEICRKNFKTYTIAVIIIVLFLTEPQFAKFYSVAPDYQLSSEVREAIAETLRSSPLVYEYKDQKRFKILRDYIQFKLNSNKYIPLSFSNNRMDGRLPNAFCADEVGALPTSYPIDAMRSGQLVIKNKIGFIISTKYPTIDNPFEGEVSYSKKVLDKLVKDESRFSLLYEPDNTSGWETDDLILKQANPAALEIPEIWEDLLRKRALAVAMESARENFVTKHCNIIYQGLGTETYIDVKDVQACRVASIDWTGRVVYVGFDLSETDDNTSVSIVSVDDDNRILFDSWAFIPGGRIEEKTAAEKVNYRELIRSGKVIACGDRTIDYPTIEAFILGLEEKLGVEIQAVGFDRWNALSSAQKIEAKGYNVVEIRQHSSVLHPPTKLLKEKLLNGEASYERNLMLEINFQNARCVYDTNRNLYVSKKKSRGKVDMVVSLINALYLAQQDYFLDGGSEFVADVL